MFPIFCLNRIYYSIDSTFLVNIYLVLVDTVILSVSE
jgi:hypothetical protein